MVGLGLSIPECFLTLIYFIVTLSLVVDVELKFFSAHPLMPNIIGLGVWMTWWVISFMEI